MTFTPHKKLVEETKQKDDYEQVIMDKYGLSDDMARYVNPVEFNYDEIKRLKSFLKDYSTSRNVIDSMRKNNITVELLNKLNQYAKR